MHQNVLGDTVKVLNDNAAAIKMTPERNLRAFLIAGLHPVTNPPAIAKTVKKLSGNLQEQAFPATLLTVAEKNDKMMITNGVSSLRS